jgi:hypothetical protein
MAWRLLPEFLKNNVRRCCESFFARDDNASLQKLLLCYGLDQLLDRLNNHQQKLRLWLLHGF